VTNRFLIRFSALRPIGVTCAMAIIAVTPSMAGSVTFAQYDQTNGAQQQWTISESTVSMVTTTTVSATGAVMFTFSGVAGVPFTGAEAATFNLTAMTTQTGQCNSSTCTNGNSYDQPGYSGSFSFIDAGAVPGTDLLSGTFSVTENPALTGGTFGAQVGSKIGTFGASTDTTNAFQVMFTSDYLTFAGITSETASWSLSSLQDALSGAFATTATTNSQAYPLTTYTAAGTGTFSTTPGPPSAVPEPATSALIGGALLGLGLLRRKPVRQ